MKKQNKFRCKKNATNYINKFMAIFQLGSSTEEGKIKQNLTNNLK